MKESKFVTTATANRVMEQAMALPKAKQRILLGKLWKQLDWGHPLPPPMDEIRRRAESAKKGTSVLHGAEDVKRDLERRRAIAVKRLHKDRPTQ